MKNMGYHYTANVQQDEVLRASFNELTRQTFGFDFENWYKSGHWGELYIPHVLTVDNKVVSNVSVNLMQFKIGDTSKKYIQIGTVMTDLNYRGQGLNREIMERILAEYKGKFDGIYLFGNDSVLNYYPKYGFKAAIEYEYYLPLDKCENVSSYTLEKINTEDDMQREKLSNTIRACMNIPNENDAFYMNENLGLYQFWFAAAYEDSIYYLPETDSYVIAEIQEQTLFIHQILGREKIDIIRLANSFEDNLTEAVLGFTPIQKENLFVREHKEEDCTLFILGEDLARIEKDKMMFPILSHA